MSCYIRHLKEIFEQAGIELRPEDRRRADLTIHEMLGATDERCPQVWSSVKEWLSRDREGFVNELRRRWDRGGGKE